MKDSNIRGSNNSNKINRKVLLVVPPFHATRCPALGVSQLKANLTANGYYVEVLYLNLLFSERVTPLVYEWLTGTGKSLFGEFIFSFAVFDREDEEIDRYLEAVLCKSDFAGVLRNLFPNKPLGEIVRHLINEAVEFVNTDAIKAVLDRDPWLVGFSSTFESNCASLAVTKQIKKQRSEIVTVMGGANCEGEMGEELKSQFAEVDFVGQGECDHTFVGLVRALHDGKPDSGLEGFMSNELDSRTGSSSPLNGEQLDALPHPDFTDFFSQFAQFRYRDQIRPGLAMETSRGCWWGFKQHCTFCAFNRLGMIYRSKSPERVLAEMEALMQKHGISRMELTDNILDMNYFKTILPKLAEKPKAELFWETKSNMSREQVAMLRKAKVVWIQPGIESLSDKSLKLMKKGTTQVQNIQLLKWCTEYGIKISWNWLYGFPGEDEKEIDELVETVKKIHHLQPPNGSAVLFLERFAPYQMTPEEWGITNIQPTEAYRHVYPFSDESLDRMAFFFDCDSFDKKENSEAYQRLKRAIGLWKEVNSEAHLLAVAHEKKLVIYDTRPCAKRFIQQLSGLKRQMYEYCDKGHNLRDITKTFGDQATSEQISGILASFVADDLMLEKEGRYLSLATDIRVGYRAFPKTFPGGHILVDHEETNGHNGVAGKIFDLLRFRITPRQAAEGVRRRIHAAKIDRLLPDEDNQNEDNGYVKYLQEKPGQVAEMS